MKDLGFGTGRKEGSANKTSQTIPAKRPFFHDDLNQINPQPTGKPN